MTDFCSCGILDKDEKLRRRFRVLFSYREKKSPAASFFKFRQFLSFPPELHF